MPDAITAERRNSFHDYSAGGFVIVATKSSKSSKELFMKSKRTGSLNSYFYTGTISGASDDSARSSSMRRISDKL